MGTSTTHGPQPQSPSLSHDAALDRRTLLKGIAAAGSVAGLGALASSLTATGALAAEKDASASDASASADAASEAAAPAVTAAADGVTPGYVCGTDWLGPKPQIADEDIAEVIDTEILVIGAGHAGIQCACAAAEGGAKVDVLETVSEDARKVKGEDIGHCNSQWLIDQGYGPYDVGEITEEFCIRCGGRVRQELVRKYVANSGEAVDHLMGLVSWPDDRIKLMPTTDNPEVSPLDPGECICQVPGIALDGPVDYPMCRGGYRSWPGTAMFMGHIRHDVDPDVIPIPGAFSRLDEVVQFTILKSQELGATYHYEESGVVLTQDETGRVTGAISQRADGTYVRYNASTAVCLCAGDYGSNPDMVWALQGELAEWAMRAGKGPEDLIGMSGGMGDGIKMGCWAGGFMEAGPRACNQNGSGAGGPWGVAGMLWLNADGKRFMNEASVQQNMPVILRQPAGIIAGITDANWAESVKNSATDHGSPNFGRPDYFYELQEDMANVELDNPAGSECRKMTIAERDHTLVWGSETLEGLLGMLGYEGDALQTALDQIAHYNELCHAGADVDFGKDVELMIPIETPPFYAAYAQNKKWAGVGLGTMGGLECDDDMAVLDASGRPIGGLYAAGRCLGGLFGFSNPNPFAGKNVGSAITLGRVLGKQLTGQEIA